MAIKNLNQWKRALEESFFAKVNDELLHKYRENLERMELREALRECAGIRSEELLDACIKHQIRPETAAALALTPLVYVAWADGKLQKKERQAVLDAAAERGMASEVVAVLEQWLEEQPPEVLLAAWKEYMAALVSDLDVEEIHRMRERILDGAHRVAGAAGGILGTGRVCASEREAFATFEAYFDELITKAKGS